MNILFVGGTFDDNGGRPSSVVNKFYDCLIKNKNVHQVALFNGGNFNTLEGILDGAVQYDTVIWWANVPNDKPKIRNVKEVNPKTMLVTSKRNDNNKYTFVELINRALSIKANLSIEFSKIDNKFNMNLYDPLGNSWYNGTEIGYCCNKLVERLQFLKSITRQGCINIVNNNVEIPDDEAFFELIKKYADVFHDLINPAKNVTRFLGNSSFRCQRGFPSFKKDGFIYVSRRNVDKRFIDKENFVPTLLKDNKVYYYGENKPSVDTPIQLRLYDKLPKINYIIHAHVYLENCPFTFHMIPCGGIEEVEEILNVIKNNYGHFNSDFYAINLIGHGCIAMSSDVDKLKNLKYVKRNTPEVIEG